MTPSEFNTIINYCIEQNLPKESIMVVRFHKGKAIAKIPINNKCLLGGVLIGDSVLCIRNEGREVLISVELVNSVEIFTPDDLKKFNETNKPIPTNLQF